MVEIGGLQDQDHEVLGNQYCSGYTDSFGKWNTGFYCPTLGEQTVYCCGTSNHKYCCTQRDEDRIAAPLIDQTTLLGIVLGCMILVVLVTVASCLLCRRCVMKRKRQHAAINGGPLYQMHCSSSSGSGVANMYAFSGGGGGGENGCVPSPLDVHMEMNGQQHGAPRDIQDRGDYVIDDTFAAFPPNNQELSRAMRNAHMNCPLNHSEPPPPYREIRSSCSMDSSVCTSLSRPNGIAVTSQSAHSNRETNNIQRGPLPSFRATRLSTLSTEDGGAGRSQAPSTFRPQNTVPSAHRGEIRQERITHI